jgi:hypothetical protein
MLISKHNYIFYYFRDGCLMIKGGALGCPEGVTQFSKYVTLQLLSRTWELHACSVHT